MTLLHKRGYYCDVTKVLLQLSAVAVCVCFTLPLFLRLYPMTLSLL